MGPATTAVATGRIYLTPNAFPDGTGAFAWWISGENQKALLHPADNPAAPAPTINEAMQRVRTYGNTDLAALALVGTPPGTSLPTRGTAALVPVATVAVPADAPRSATARSTSMITRLTPLGY